MGNIGNPQRRIEVLPDEEQVPIPQHAPAPAAPAPTKPAPEPARR